jgi:hypothetical protein
MCDSVCLRFFFFFLTSCWRVSEDAGGDGGGEEEGDGSQEQELHARADAHRQEGNARNGLQTGELPEE